ncbi:hypothetical protein ABW19_dt0204164 [Dactylella cylindrospora]|nr:hypothetical protein ABW19_dt0204164 [Dactylella cylindrospora]
MLGNGFAQVHVPPNSTPFALLRFITGIESIFPEEVGRRSCPKSITIVNQNNIPMFRLCLARTDHFLCKFCCFGSACSWPELGSGNAEAVSPHITYFAPIKCGCL